MTRGIIYYTTNALRDEIALPVRKKILESGLPITSVSLEPIDFGNNIVLDLKPNIITMYKQILTALEACDTDIVFFCEHDVLYHKTHFDFEPEKDNIFYYNTNVWQWKYPEDLAITYDSLTSLSGLCCYRELALNHYKQRLELIEKNGWDKDISNEPYWIRRMGYEPGVKSKRQELIKTNGYAIWQSEYSNIDIRHKNTFTSLKMNLDKFKHKPTNWKETKLDKIDGWNLKKLFN